jgi:hypothetical protein
MLLVRELHSVRGEALADLEAVYRDGWMPRLAASLDARLLWYLHQAHGTGPAYTVITYTAVRDGAAWQRLAERRRDGDLLDISEAVDAACHESAGKVVMPVVWSPLQDVELDAVPVDAATHEPGLWMEDSGWPYSPLQDYVRFWDEGYRRRIESRPDDERVLDIVACFETAHGSGPRPEAILMQRIRNLERLRTLLATPQDTHGATASAYMEEALRHRDRWESRLLRSAPWSPFA